jgi:hypothetical protein
MKYDKVKAFAKEKGYDDALYIGKWKEYEAYEPVFDGDDVSFVGVPLLILVKDDDIRMSTVEEAFEQLQAANHKAKIIAKGLYLGRERIVECFLEDGFPIIELDGEYDEAVQSNFNQLLKKAPALGGTYYPPENSLLAAYSVLENTFFDDSPIEIKTEGDIGKIPTYDVDDIVY